MNDISLRLSVVDGWFSIVPGVTITIIFVIFYLAYRVRFRYRKFPHYEEIDKRPASEILNRHFRTFLFWMVAPLENYLVKAKVLPNAITLVSLVLAFISGILLAIGNFGLGGWIYIFSGICDIFDGRVARKTGNVTPSGGIIDSVADRYSEFSVFAGLAWFYSGSWVIVVVFAAFFGSLMVSYVRAKSESFNIKCDIGRFQRPERLVCLGIGTALSPFLSALIESGDTPRYGLTIVVLLIIAIGSNSTAIYRVFHSYTHLTKRPPKEFVQIKIENVPGSRA